MKYVLVDGLIRSIWVSHTMPDWRKVETNNMYDITISQRWLKIKSKNFTKALQNW